jgi:hypothetical protein
VRDGNALIILKNGQKTLKTQISIHMKCLQNKRPIIVILVLTLCTSYIRSQTSFIWGKQFGSDKDEYAMNHLTDSNGNIYVAGKTTGIMDGTNVGENDGFLTKIDSLGNTIWTRQFGSSGDEDIQWSAIDYTGSVYITGFTTGILGNGNFGKEDIFIVKYTPQGVREWTRQFGTDSTDVAKGIFADNKGSVYITGMTGGKLGQNSYGKTDCFILKLDGKGNQVFISQFGTSGDDCSYSITGGPDSDIYVCGTTWGDMAGKNKGFIDGFTGEFTGKGDLVKYNQFGTDGFDIAMILKVDNDRSIYVGGSTSGSFGSGQIGEGDGFFLKLSEKGTILWNNQFGTRNNDGVRSIDFDPVKTGNMLVSGILNLPPARGFIRMYKKDGALLWERKFAGIGLHTGTSGKSVSFDNRGNLYHLGLTGANLFGTLIGENDVYLVKLGLDDLF